MNDDTIQLIALAVISLIQVYAVSPGTLDIFASFWNALATLFGAIANFFGDLAMGARLNYFEAVNSNG
jgi:hypothetical protein